MEILLDWFGHPEKNFLSIIIAGTKGKGSTGFFLESILSEAGIRTGYYHSPHLMEATERIRLEGASIPKSEWTRILSQIKFELRRKKLSSRLGGFTYFEILTLLAMLYFAQKKVKIGIFEVGMGGRLDATNVVKAPLAILTPISFDHEAALGNTLTRIAGEKAAVIHRASHVVTGAQPQEAMTVIEKRIRSMHARLWKALPARRPLGLYGDFQQLNAGLALKAVEILKNYYGVGISSAAIKKGLNYSNWMGRWELLKTKPQILLDAAHNPASIEALVRNLKKIYPKKKRLLIFAISKDKNSPAILKKLSSYFSDVILTGFLSPRARVVGSPLEQAHG